MRVRLAHKDHADLLEVVGGAVLGPELVLVGAVQQNPLPARIGVARAHKRRVSIWLRV